jgi:hypothetical protein
MPTATYTVPVTGPQSVTAFAELLAASRDAHVPVPVHPGFGGTHRPDGLTGVPALARLYNGLIDQLGLDVTVIGNSLGGWTAAEIALLRSPRVSPRRAVRRRRCGSSRSTWCNPERETRRAQATSSGSRPAAAM